MSAIDPDLVERYPGTETKYLINEALTVHGPQLRQALNRYYLRQ